MFVLALVLAATVLLVHGILADHLVEVVIAGVLSVGTLVAIVGEHWWRARTSRKRADEGEELLDVPGDDTEPAGPKAETDPADADESGALDVGDMVFVAGRSTFHLPTCSSVAGKAVNRGSREQLEADGMNACRRCLRD